MTEKLFISSGRNVVTIIGVFDKEEKVINIGVARCGNGQKYNKELGIEIARNRANIQPYTTISSKGKVAFDTTCEVICNHINYQKQVHIQNLRKKKD